MSERKAKSNSEWIRWGEVDPLYGVALWPRKEKGGISPWTDEDFYKLGELDWNDFLKHWEKYGIDKTSCLEIGCGAGRITMHLCRYFQSTYAIDVSKKMIDYARDHIQNPSVTFYLTEGIEIPLSDNSVSAVFSAHVFQHFDSLSHAIAYFEEISRVLISGGSMMIHLPVYSWPVKSMFSEILYLLRERAADIKACVWRRLTALGLLRPTMRGLRYPVDYFYDTLPKQGFTDIEISYFAVRSNNSIHPCVFARKATNSESIQLGEH